MPDFKCRSSQRYRTYNSSECCENYRSTVENCLNKFYLSIQIFINKTLDRHMSYMHHLKIAGAYFTIYFTTLPRDQGTGYNEIRISFQQGRSNLMLHIVTWCLQGCWTLPVVSVIVVAAQTLKAPLVCPTATDRWHKDKEHTCELLNNLHTSVCQSQSSNIAQRYSTIIKTSTELATPTHFPLSTTKLPTYKVNLYTCLSGDHQKGVWE